MDYDDNPTFVLKEAIDINDLQLDEDVCFEIKPDDDLTDMPATNNYFDGEDVCQNLYNVDDSDEDDVNSTPFERLARKMEDVSPLKDGGVLKMVLKQGVGLVVSMNSLVRIHYNEYLEYADEPFDSSRLQNTVKKFRLGAGEAIEGFDLAVCTMRKGELSRFLIRSQYAYLKMGCPPRIPENATIMMEIELLSFVEHVDGIEDYFHMTEDEKRQVAFTDVKKLFHAITKEAKELYKENLLRQAFPKFKKACCLLEECNLQSDMEEKEQQKELVKVYNNLAVLCVKQSHSGRAIVYSRKCLEIDKNNAKALYLYGKALHQQSYFEKARDYIIRAQKLKPSDPDVNAELEKIERDMANFKLLEKDICQKMFSKSIVQTEKEKNNENQKRKTDIEKSLKCSEDFRKMVMEKLEQFKDDKDLVEFPLPSFNFTMGEIECIIGIAENLGLEAKVKGSGQSKFLKVFKKNQCIS